MASTHLLGEQRVLREGYEGEILVTDCEDVREPRRTSALPLSERAVAAMLPRREEKVVVMVRPAKLGHLALRVDSVPEALEFYRNVVGLTVTGREGKMVFLSADPNSSHELALMPGAAAAGVSKARLDHLAFEMSTFADLQTLFDRLHDRGIPVTVSKPGTAQRIYFRDPSGTVVEAYYELSRQDYFLKDVEGFPYALQRGGNSDEVSQL